MKLSIRPSLFFAATCLPLGLWTNTAIACKCKLPDPPRIALKNTDAVFSRRVLSVQKQGEHSRKVEIKINRVWKGVSKPTLFLTTATESAACGFNFQKGMSYLIYAHKDSRTAMLSTNVCTRTTPLSRAQEDLKALGKGKKIRAAVR